MAQTARLGLALMAAAQAQKHVTHNDALLSIDALVQAVVAETDRLAPPAAPQEGDAYLIGTAPTGAFAGQAGMLAAFISGSWRFFQPQTGWLVFVKSRNALMVLSGGSWHVLDDLAQSFANLKSLGIGTSADAVNRLAVKTNAALFVATSAAEGGSGDLRVAFNKPLLTGTVSHLFQTNWSGRTELGLTGDDQFHIKVSPDGSTWTEALVCSSTTGAVRMDRMLAGRATPRVTACYEAEFAGASKQGIALNDTGTAASTAISFSRAGVLIGSVGLASAGVSFNTTSDYRLKTAIKPLSCATDRLKQLKPLRYSFVSHQSGELDGFLAHEVAAVVPEAVTGAKDAVDPHGLPVWQQLDQTRLIPLLVAALQEALTRIETLEAR